MKKIILTIPVIFIGCVTPPIEVMPETIDEYIPDKEGLLHEKEYHTKKEQPVKEAPPVGHPGDSLARIKEKAKKMRNYNGHGTSYTKGYHHNYDSFHRKYYQKHGISPH